MRVKLFKNGVRSALGNGILKERLNQWREMAFKVGDRVVYPHHGAAIVEEKKSKNNIWITQRIFNPPDGDG